MSISLIIANDDDIMTVYDAFGPEFWTRVIENTEEPLQPLQQEVKFSGKINPRTRNFEFEPGEDKRAELLFKFLENLLSPDDYKFTPFLQQLGSVQTFRYTFQPSSSRFIFQPGSMPALTDVAHKGRSLAALRDIEEILADRNNIYGIVRIWLSQQMDIESNFKILTDIMAQHKEGRCSDADIAKAFSTVLADREENGKTIPGLQSAIDGMHKAIIEDQILVIHQSKITRLETLQGLLKIVIAQIKREELQAQREREQILSSFNKT